MLLAAGSVSAEPATRPTSTRERSATVSRCWRVTLLTSGERLKQPPGSGLMTTGAIKHETHPANGSTRGGRCGEAVSAKGRRHLHESGIPAIILIG